MRRFVLSAAAELNRAIDIGVIVAADADLKARVVDGDIACEACQRRAPSASR
jgi:hypothetical protein